ncbi:MAG: DNA-processing protein DprA [Patescibacteria group bacterium]
MDRAAAGFIAAAIRTGSLKPPELLTLLVGLDSPEALWSAAPERMIGLGIAPAAALAFARSRPAADPKKEADELARHDVAAVAFNESEYPSQLRQIFDPPAILFYRGRLAALRGHLPVAVVGTRGMTEYGARAARLFTRQLATAGCTIVSGLALGVDAAAHEACLEANGITVAVLASGTDRPSVGPRTNAGLAERIVKADGVVVSEYPPGTISWKDNFLKRNRIIAGLSRGVVVIEAAERSGALVTARLALEQGRDVFAVPGPIFSPKSLGCNRLIQTGASPLITIEDIFQVYDLKISTPAVAKQTIIDPAQKAIFTSLAAGSATTDELAVKTGLTPPEVLAAVSALELAGLVATHYNKVVRN